MDERVFKASRKWQTIQETATGRQFIRINNTRYFLDEFENYPIKEAGIRWQGVLNLTFFSCYLIRLDAEGERAQYCYSYT